MVQGRSPGAVLSRLHHRARGAFEVAAMAGVGILAGIGLSEGDPLRFVATVFLAAALAGLMFGLYAEIRGDFDALFGELEALGWLKEQLRLEIPLKPTRKSAADPSFLVEVIRAIDTRKPSLVVELGSGVSTVVIARRLKQAGRGRLVSFDHDPKYAEQTRGELERHDMLDVAEVVLAPLTEVSINGTAWRWYEPPAGLHGIDLLVVDGPPGSIGRLARYPALPVLAESLSPGAVICLDDAARPDEQAAVARWQRECPAMNVGYVDNAAGAYILTLPPEPQKRSD